MINIYDGNNYYRRALEGDPSGFAPRQVFHEMGRATEPTIWVWDGMRGNERRRELFPDYKANRFGRVLTDVYAAFDFMRDLLTYTNVIQIQVPGYEGDDVVAALARQQAACGEQVGIFSADFDFLQLSAEYPKHIFCGCTPKATDIVVKPEHVRVFKVAVGDPSDNIPGIKGFGAQSWTNNDPDQLSAAIARWLKNGVYDDDHALDLYPRTKNWLKDNIPQLQIFWDIVGFYEVPDELLTQHMTVGRPNFAAGAALLKRYLN